MRNNPGVVADHCFTGTTLARLIMVIVWCVGTSCSASDENAHQGHEVSGMNGRQTVPVLAVPQEMQRGEARFQTLCSRCHGEQGRGTDHGPPLVHKIYEPSHHGDFAFFRAATQGVRAHHWKYGDMPAIPGVSENDIQDIVGYVRWLQRQAGIS